MSSIVDNISQNKRVYAPTEAFKTTYYDTKGTICMDENIPPFIIGIVVDYLTRYMLTNNKKSAFRTSVQGAAICGRMKKAKKLFQKIDGLSDESITAACKLAYFDVYARDKEKAADQEKWLSLKTIRPDEQTIQNIRIMVENGLAFLKDEGPVIGMGFSFAPNGYRGKIKGGEGDYLTEDTIWDFKVSKYDLTKEQTLQILMYYIMGKQSGNPKFDQVKYIGIFNPRKNKSYRIKVKDLPKKNRKKLKKKMGF